MRGGLVEPIGKQSVPKPDGRGRPRSIDGVGVIGDGVETRTNCTSSCSINLFDVTDNLFLLAHLRRGTVPSTVRIWPPEALDFPATTTHLKETHVDRTS